MMCNNGTTHRNQMFDAFKGIATLGIIFIHYAQWFLSFSSDSIAYRLQTSSLRGVEITFLISAYFFNVSYAKIQEDDTKEKAILILKRIFRIIPIYYMGIILWLLCASIAQKENQITFINFFVHLLCLQGLFPSMWNNFMGGTGYIGILVLMLIFYPSYLKHTKDIKSSFIWGGGTVTVSYIAYNVVLQIVAKINPTAYDGIYSWLWYMHRGIYTFAVGRTLYLFIRSDKIKFSKRETEIETYLILIYLVLQHMAIGNLYDGLWLTIQIAVLIVLNYRYCSFLLRSKVLSFLGKYSMEMYILHILLYYILIEDFSVQVYGWKAAGLLFLISAALSPIVNRLIQKPCDHISKMALQKLQEIH